MVDTGGDGVQWFNSTSKADNALEAAEKSQDEKPIVEHKLSEKTLVNVLQGRVECMLPFEKIPKPPLFDHFSFLFNDHSLLVIER